MGGRLYRVCFRKVIGKQKEDGILGPGVMEGEMAPSIETTAFI